MNATTYTQVTFATLIAKDLKKELTSYGIKVLMCKNSGKNKTVANVAIEGSLKNFELFAEFAKENGLVNALRKPHVNNATVDYPYIDLYGVYKIESSKKLL